MTTPVDVLIIGAGASGAAVAWSLAETKMQILCLEGMDHMRLHPMRTKPARQPEAVTAGFESQCNPRDLAAGRDHLVAPAMHQAKQPFCTRLQLLARLAINAGKHTGN